MYLHPNFKFSGLFENNIGYVNKKRKKREKKKINNKAILPKKLDHIHAFHPDYQQLIDHNQNVSFQVLKESPTLKSKLLIKQKGLCYFCNTNLLGTDGQHIYDGSLHIHHKESRASAGSKSRLQT